MTNSFQTVKVCLLGLICWGNNVTMVRMYDRYICHLIVDKKEDWVCTGIRNKICRRNFPVTSFFKQRYIFHGLEVHKTATVAKNQDLKTLSLWVYFLSKPPSFLSFLSSSCVLYSLDNSSFSKQTIVSPSSISL